MQDISYVKSLLFPNKNAIYLKFMRNEIWIRVHKKIFKDYKERLTPFPIESVLRAVSDAQRLVNVLKYHF